MIPEYVILDTYKAVDSFRSTMSSIDEFWHYCDDESHIEQMVDYIVDCFADVASCWGALEDLTHEVQNFYASFSPQEKILVAEEMHKVGETIMNELARIGAFNTSGPLPWQQRNSEGNLWYEFAGFVNENDILLRKLSQEGYDSRLAEHLEKYVPPEYQQLSLF